MAVEWYEKGEFISGLTGVPVSKFDLGYGLDGSVAFRINDAKFVFTIPVEEARNFAQGLIDIAGMIDKKGQT